MSTVVRCHYAPKRMDKIQNAENTKCWQGCALTGNVISAPRNANGIASLKRFAAPIQKTKNNCTISD